MYDSVTMHLPDACVSEDKLSDVSYHSYGMSNYTTAVGYLQNLRITLRQDETMIKGSLARFYYKHNIDTLLQTDVPKALECLSDALCVNVSEGIVKRVDVAATLLMKHDPASYLQILEDYPRTKRVVHTGETVSFINSARAVIFYDKFKEMGKAHSRSMRTPVERLVHKELLRRIPRNILRCECQLKNLKRMFPSGLKVFQLANDAVYLRLIAEWRQACLGVTKSGATAPQTSATTPKELIQNLASAGLRAIGGLSRALDIVSHEPTMNAMQKSRVRKKLRSLTQMNTGGADDLAKELDDAIRAAASAALTGVPESTALFRIGSADTFPNAKLGGLKRPLA